MLQAVNTDIFNPSVPKAHNIEGQNSSFLYKLSQQKSVRLVCGFLFFCSVQPQYIGNILDTVASPKMCKTQQKFQAKFFSNKMINHSIRTAKQLSVLLFIFENLSIHVNSHLGLSIQSNTLKIKKRIN